MKHCPSCGLTQPLDNFYNNRAQHDGKAIYCKECRKQQRRSGKESLGNPYTIAFHRQKGQAKARGIEFCFTRNEWVSWWGEDIDKRGCKPDDLHMCRHGDTGPYHPDNVYKDTCRNNSRDGRRSQLD